MARPVGSNSAKPFRDALRMEILEAGGEYRALRRIARALIGKGNEGDIVAIKEIADRLDGKVAQVHSGDEEGPPIKTVLEITWKQAALPPPEDDDEHEK